MTRFGYVIATVAETELPAALFVTVAIVQPRPRRFCDAERTDLALQLSNPIPRPSVDMLVAGLLPTQVARWHASGAGPVDHRSARKLMAISALPN